jgi:hypothetical protein
MTLMLALRSDPPLRVAPPQGGTGRTRTQNWLSNRVFDTYEEIIDAACDAWRKLIAQPGSITSIGMREWAHTGQK